MQVRVSALALAVSLGLPAAAEAPLSAIDWLSDSIAAPQAAPQQDDIAGTTPSDISVTTLDAPPAQSVGLLPPSTTGLPKALWGPSTVDDILARLKAVPTRLPPSLDALATNLLLAEAEAPREQVGDEFLLARVDRLLAAGALERAEALLERAGVDSVERFRRLFDIALLTGKETAACERMRRQPDVSPTYQARIFCLARGGDWPSAALTLDTASALGVLTPAEDALLARFLDDEIVDDVSLENNAPSPLTYRLLEAIGEPVSTGRLPVAYAWADLRHTSGWKAQIEAAERLARAGVLPARQLFDLYLLQRPSASGGVWERAKAIHNLRNAITSGQAARVAAVLPEAWAHMENAGLAYAFAETYGAQIANLGVEGELAFHIALLSPAYDLVAAQSGETQDPFLVALARGIPETAIAHGEVAAAIRQGFLDNRLPLSAQALLDDGRIGEATLKAIALFAEGAAGDTDGISAAIALLRELGHEETARRAALDLLLLDARG